MVSFDQSVEIDLPDLSKRVRNVQEKRPATCRRTGLRDRMPFWSGETCGDWEIVKSSRPYAKVNAHTLQYVEKVPKDGKVTVNYRVRMRW